jgi:hypothetical protein
MTILLPTEILNASDKDRVYADLGAEVLEWETHTAGGDRLGFVSRGFQRKRRSGEAVGGTLKAPHWTWVDWWAENRSGQVSVSDDDDGEAMGQAKAIVDYLLGFGEKPEGFDA